MDKFSLGEIPFDIQKVPASPSRLDNPIARGSLEGSDCGKRGGTEPRDERNCSGPLSWPGAFPYREPFWHPARFALWHFLIPCWRLWLSQVRLVSNRTQDLTLEAAIRWNAQDAQVALVIAPLRGVTLIPKLRKIHMYATVRVVLRPLVPKIPCFGAIAVALKQPPLVNFELDFGMLDIAQVTSRQFGKVGPWGVTAFLRGCPPPGGPLPSPPPLAFLLPVPGCVAFSSLQPRRGAGAVSSK